MTYASQQDLVDRFGSTELAQLTDPAAGATIDATDIARALADAGAEMDAYIGARYALPLANVPAILLRVCCDIARYRLWDTAPPDNVATRYSQAVALLRLIASGQTVLAGAAALSPADGAVTVTSSSRTRQFSDDLMDRFAPPL